MKSIKSVIFGLLILQVLSYIVFAQLSSEKTVEKEYIVFTKKRLKNKLVKNIPEIVIVASCGDEFFRNKNSLDKVVKKSNPKNTKDEFSYSAWRDSYNVEPMSSINKYIDDSESICCIVYKICSENTIPFLFKKINYEYLYSDKETDYHIMFHNSQIYNKTISYIWCLGFWIKL